MCNIEALKKFLYVLHKDSNLLCSSFSLYRYADTTVRKFLRVLESIHSVSKDNNVLLTKVLTILAPKVDQGAHQLFPEDWPKLPLSSLDDLKILENIIASNHQGQTKLVILID